ncbi:MAG: DedA family protein [Ignavibacteriales bacterium]|nr:DedA family protein [Ignavibacteriales bacterium]
MELISQFFDFVLHIDVHLKEIIAQYNAWSYVILFIVIFAETGFVLTPFLPGDSLLFAAGTFAAIGAFNLVILILILCIAAIAGDTVNYWIGDFIGPKIFAKEKIKFLKKEHLQKTHEFYERHGGKTIIIARFIPIIRSFAPFVAGIGSMTYLHFIVYNVVGGILWVISFVIAGYFFGNLPFVRNNFSLVILAIIFISTLPGIIGYLKSKFSSPQNNIKN